MINYKTILRSLMPGKMPGKQSVVLLFIHTILLLISFPGFLSAQTPVLKVDLNIANRSEAEVNEPGYIPWVLDGTRLKTYEGVTFEFKNGDSPGSWYKAGVQAPYYARLVNDGIKTNDVELYIYGLPRGNHTLVTFHNIFDSPEAGTYSPVDIYLNGVLEYDNLELTNRATANDAATTAFFKFEVDDNDTVVVRFVSDPPSDTVSDKITICGFHLNSSDPKRMARFEYPENKDEHVDIDNDTLLLSWKAPDNVVSQNIYFGTDKNDVLMANTGSPQFIGNIPDTFFVRTGFYSLDNYYWRVDPISSKGDTTTGDVWYFKKRIHAFPGAEGYGGYAIGGRGGKVVYVTNLDDSGPGSFRDAVENYEGPRTILFHVGGLITLRSRLIIQDDYITIAGQTAPGKGICFRWAPIGVTGDNLIVQNLRMRLGAGITYDGMGLTGAGYSIIDHCSVSWTIDEAVSSRGAKNITLQRTLISEALNAAGHSNYPIGTEHGYAGSIGGDIGSFHHNLLAHCYGRNWSMAGGLDGNGYYAGRLDLFNNVVYNWGSRATDGGAHEVNFVGNYYKKGTATTQNTILRAQLEGTGKGSQSYYTYNNIVENTNGTLSCDGTGNTCSRAYILSNGQVLDWDVFADEPFFSSEATIHSAGDAYKLVLSDVGCNQPVFDDHDVRIVDETLNGTYSCTGSYTGKPGLPDHEGDVGAWEAYPGYLRSAGWDTDLDGLPDWWESVLGLNPGSSKGDFSDSNADEDKNGYTNLEEYLQWMGSPHYFLDTIKGFDIDLLQYTKGFTGPVEFEVPEVINGEATVNGSLVHYIPSALGLSRLKFTVTDPSGTSMSQNIGFYVGEIAEDSAFAYSYALDRDTTRLVIVEPDTASTSVSEMEKALVDINIYPNPATNRLIVGFNACAGSFVGLKVYNMIGQPVIDGHYRSIQGRNSLEMDISGLQPGIYFLKIITPENYGTAGFVKN